MLEINEKQDESKTKKIITLIHFAIRAGKVTYGLDPVIRKCGINKAKLVILARDLGNNSNKKIIRTIETMNIDAFRFGTKQMFEEIFNKGSIGIISIDDLNFAKGLTKTVNAE